MIKECPVCGEKTRKYVRAHNGVWVEYDYCVCGWNGPISRTTYTEQGRESDKC